MPITRQLLFAKSFASVLPGDSRVHLREFKAANRAFEWVELFVGVSSANIIYSYLMSKQNYITFKHSLTDAEITSYTVSDGVGGNINFNISAWNDERFILIAKGVDYIEDTGTYQLSGITTFPELDTDTAKGYAVLDHEGDISMRFRASSVTEIDG